MILRYIPFLSKVSSDKCFLHQLYSISFHCRTATMVEILSRINICVTINHLTKAKIDI